MKICVHMQCEMNTEYNSISTACTKYLKDLKLMYKTFAVRMLSIKPMCSGSASCCFVNICVCARACVCRKYLCKVKVSYTNWQSFQCCKWGTDWMNGKLGSLLSYIDMESILKRVRNHVKKLSVLVRWEMYSTVSEYVNLVWNFNTTFSWCLGGKLLNHRCLKWVPLYFNL